MEASTFETVSLTEATSTFNYHVANSYLFVISVIISVAVLPGNMLTIAAFVKDRGLRVPSNYLVCNQSVINALSAFFYIPFAYFKLNSVGVEILKSSSYTCIFTLTTVSFLFLSSAINILTIGVQRMLFVIVPHLSRSSRLGSVTLSIIFFNHVSLLAFLSLPYWGINRWQPDIPCTYYLIFVQSQITIGIAISFITLFGIIVTNIFIYYRYKKQQRLVGDSSSAKSKKDWKLTIMLVIVAANFIVTWAPTLITDSVRRFFPSLQSSSVILIIAEVNLLLVLANGITNPFIYTGKNQRFREAFKRTLGFSTTDRRRSSVLSTSQALGRLRQSSVRQSILTITSKR